MTRNAAAQVEDNEDQDKDDDADAKDANDETPLTLAEQSGNQVVVRLLQAVTTYRPVIT